MGRFIRLVMTALVVTFLTACGEPPDVKGAESEVLAFAKKISEHDIRGAFDLLSEDYRKELGFDIFDKRAKRFLNSKFGSIQRIYVQQSDAMRGWRTRESGDVGWAYVIIEGSEFADAISGTVKREGNRLRIRNIDWSKP